MKKFEFEIGDKLTGLVFKQALLCLLSFGVYLPWAITKIRKALWTNTSLDGKKFYYLGQAKELIYGYLTLLVLLVCYKGAQSIGAGFVSNTLMTVLFSSVSSFFFVSFLFKARLGSFKYQVNRTLYNGIRLKTELPSLRQQYLTCFWYAFLTVITFGVGYFYFSCKIDILKYNSFRYGDQKFEFTMTPSDYYAIGFKYGLLYALLTGIGGVASVGLIKLLGTLNLGPSAVFISTAIGSIVFAIIVYIVSVASMREFFNAKIDHLSSNNILLESNLEFSTIASVFFVNGLILICSLGFGFALVFVRNMKMYATAIEVDGLENLEVKDVHQELEGDIDDYASHGFELDLFDVF